MTRRPAVVFKDGVSHLIFAQKPDLANSLSAFSTLGAYLVTGFYTFVRDGVLTTAGLRGSRGAELIDNIGAANQIAPDIVRRFTCAAD